jgi:hypothetical protein
MRLRLLTLSALATVLKVALISATLMKQLILRMRTLALVQVGGLLNTTRLALTFCWGISAM